LAFYRARFADASAFTFFVVGSFVLDSIKPLVERYIGSLPATHAGETWRDVGVRIVKGPATIDEPVGPAGKTTVRLVFTDTITFGQEDAVVFDALREIAQQRLYQRLRSELHSTYGVTVALTAVVAPYAHYELDVLFDAEPAQAKSLSAAALAALDTLRMHGPTSHEVYEAMEMIQRRVQSVRRTNQYWLESLSTYAWNGWSFDVGIDSVDSLLDTLT